MTTNPARELVDAILAASPLIATGGSDGEAERIAAAALHWAADWLHCEVSTDRLRNLANQLTEKGHPMPNSAPVQYRKRPVVIEAMCWDGTAEGATPVIDWVLAGSTNGGARYHDEDGGFIAIDTLEGTMRAVAGDFVIRGVADEFYPCKPSIFVDTYEQVEAEERP